jgi:glycosyltransferase involved in cell wall biosynthesis
MKHKLLVVGDSPTVSTGFANVVRNLCKRWHESNVFDGGIDIWGINYNGWPHKFPYGIYPAGYADWVGDEKMVQLLNLIVAGDYTHLFIIMDCHALCHGKIPEMFRKVCDMKKVNLTFYYPVDSPLRKEWLQFAAIADNAITYTEYGRRETHRANPTLNPHIIPHGVDTGVYYPREDRDSIRARAFPKGWLSDDDFLMVNVNRNEKRKAPHHSLQILKALKDAHVHNVKLLMHMPVWASMNEGVNLEAIGESLGLDYGVYWKHSNELFNNGNAAMTEEGLNELYNAADLVLSTSTGEGWGLSVTEGSAAGCRIAVPWHTSLSCIADQFQKLGQIGQIRLLPTAREMVCNPMDFSRLRPQVDIDKSVEVIKDIIADKNPSPQCAMGTRFILNDAVKEWLSWERIATEFLDIMVKA